VTRRQAPVVSVIVPAHNAEETLPETIDSVRRQTLPDFELIVIDDGSTDGTAQCLQGIDDPRIRVFSYPNGGLAVARNRGIENSLGEFVTFIDADDLWTPDKLELQVEALRRRPEAVLAYSWTAFIDGQGNFLFAKEPSHLEGDVYSDLLKNCFVASGSNILMRKSCVDVVGGFDPKVEAAQDWDLCLRVAAHGEFVVVPRYQILYRIWERAMSGNALRAERACTGLCQRGFGRVAGISVDTQRQSLSNIKQYVAFLYLTRAPGRDVRKEAGRKLRECIRLYPRTLLTRKTRNLLLTWGMLHFLPFSMWRPTVMGLLRWYGRWLMLTDREVRALTRSRSMEENFSIAAATTRDGLSRTATPDVSV
jgi:glycosyltransferase involved in cell wall biosynthesis